MWVWRLASFLAKTSLRLGAPAIEQVRSSLLHYSTCSCIFFEKQVIVFQYTIWYTNGKKWGCFYDDR